jgi:hypothetical protein
MIHHVSLPAREPQRVAAVLAELMGGRAYPFRGPLPGAFMALAGDAHGTLIEVYPETTVMRPSDEGRRIPFASTAEPAAHVGWHVNLSVALEREAIERIAAREGWQAMLYGAAPPGKPAAFHVIQFWVENRTLVELITPSMLDDYLRLARFATFEPAAALEL